MPYSTWNHVDIIMDSVRTISIILALCKQRVIIALICVVVLAVASYIVDVCVEL